MDEDVALLQFNQASFLFLVGEARDSESLGERLRDLTTFSYNFWPLPQGAPLLALPERSRGWVPTRADSACPLILRAEKFVLASEDALLSSTLFRGDLQFRFDSRHP